RESDEERAVPRRSLERASLDHSPASPPWGDFVFGRAGRGFRGWSAGRRALDAALAGPRPDWVLRGFGRLASAVMHDKLGTQTRIVEAVLAHVGHRRGLAGVYNKSEYKIEKTRALTA